jgi:hypothetical protein
VAQDAALSSIIDARFRHVVYLDADVVVGAPLRDFMSLAFSLKSTAVLGAFPDSGNTGSPFHTGVLFASRGRSEPLLERWAAAILGGHYQGDQKALADVVAELRLDDAIDRFPLDGGLVRLKHADAYFAFVDAAVVRKSRKVIFLHTSKYRLENPLKFGVSLADLRAYMKRVCGIVWDIDVPSVDGHDQSTKLALAAPVDRRQNNSGEQPRQPTTARRTLDNTAIVSIAVGEKSRAFARLLIRSFQLHSEFAGPLYIATDDVDYFKTEAPDLSETGDDDDDSAKRRERRAENFARRNYALAPNVRFLLFGNGTCEQLPLPDVAVHMKKLTPEEIAKKAKAGVKSKADFTNSLEAAPQAEGGGGSGNEKELLNSHNRERLQIKWLKTQFFRMLPPTVRVCALHGQRHDHRAAAALLLDDCFAVYRRTPCRPSSRCTKTLATRACRITPACCS